MLLVVLVVTSTTEFVWASGKLVEQLGAMTDPLGHQQTEINANSDSC